MPALANPKQKRMRDSLARMVAHLTIGLGMTTAAVISDRLAYGQTCDRCAGLNVPTCGCESASGAASAPNQCSGKCPPKQSFGERLLGHFDKMGDRIEANVRSSRIASKCRCGQVALPSVGGAPTCGCEGSQPTCGCEFSFADTMGSATQPQYMPSQAPALRLNSGNPSQFGNGAISEGTNSSPPIPRAMTPAPSKSVPSPSSAPSPSGPKFSTPPMPTPEPSVQRVPFEQRKPSQEPNRIPAVEPAAPRQTKPKNLKPTPMDPPPEYVPKPDLPKKTPNPSNDPNMPDVLVDPFKDDASFRGSKQKTEGILLTGGRRTANSSSKNNAILLAPSQRHKDKPMEIDAPQEMEAKSTFDMPASLTPSQKQAPTPSNDSSLQFEASFPSSGEQSRVVPSSYLAVVPVKVTRKAPAMNVASDAANTPHVSRMRVPQKR